MKYAIINENGLPIGFYDTDIHKTIPQDAIEIPENIWLKNINGQRQVYINEVWQDYIEQPEVILDKEKKRKIVEIKQSFINAIKDGFICSNGIKMNADISDISKLKAGVDLVATLGQTSLDVRDYNNVVHNLAIDEVNNMLIELGVNYQTLLQKKWSLEDVVDKAQTLYEIEAIAW